MGFVQLSRISVLDSVFSCCLDFFQVIYCRKKSIKGYTYNFLVFNIKNVVETM